MLLHLRSHGWWEPLPFGLKKNTGARSKDIATYIRKNISSNCPRDDVFAEGTLTILPPWAASLISS